MWTKPEQATQDSTHINVKPSRCDVNDHEVTAQGRLFQITAFFSVAFPTRKLWKPL